MTTTTIASDQRQVVDEAVLEVDVVGGESGHRGALRQPAQPLHQPLARVAERRFGRDRLDRIARARERDRRIDRVDAGLAGDRSG